MNAGTRTFAGMSILAAGIVYYVHFTEQETKQVSVGSTHVRNMLWNVVSQMYGVIMASR